MQIRQNGPLEKFMGFLFTCSSVSYIVMYGTINLCGTNLCNWRLTHIIRINKTHAEKMSLYGIIQIILID